MMNETVSIAKALSDKARLRAIMALSGGELCVCQIVGLLGLAPSTVSRHLGVLHQAGLISSRKDGRWVYFRLAGPDASPPARKALRWVREALAGDSSVTKDLLSLKRITGVSKEELCRTQAKK
ncbi:MAG: winged helix-turn-helix transcriptional regulator [Deltaproteobacteria bacterium]|nr:winged helix-turn-helix transcriptional regulator [Deltaproteobacteria bacterium]MCL4873763.1 winged helix-turn-helix domain-containing protein [bacterium]